MAKRIEDLAVKNGTYRDSVSGQLKTKYENIGCVMENSDGGKFLLLKRCINLAAFPARSNDDDMVLVSRFEVKGQNQPLPAGDYYDPQAQQGHYPQNIPNPGHPHAPQQQYQQPAPQPHQYPQPVQQPGGR